ncbi:hypothetical protein V6N12_066812 [Hibiscus sabdariffa]|uniref:Uncharacterized protein n=1 Tax=Hibiscus sabdariffa TaxID=183260 RepID=A0ABR2C986_9ROSI
MGMIRGYELKSFSAIGLALNTFKTIRLGKVKAFQYTLEFLMKRGRRAKGVIRVQGNSSFSGWVRLGFFLMGDSEMLLGQGEKSNSND